MAPQDSFIDEDEDTCPLCVEEFDLSDKNFQPCPCGYQICQFCFNNIKNNINGLCPACRRPYDEKTIKWKVVTPEEVAQFKANVQKNAKKKAEIRQKEAQKREVESLNRKHLAGLRVVQKNLVYVVGLQPGIREDELLQTLRGEKYFGQYGKIIKIVVSKSKQNESAQNAGSLGVYVTFASKLDAERCIAAVNGSSNGDRILRAQLGTTKYCSAYLRNEACTNKQCMFLHEPGDNDDSYSRQDLSSINSVNSQRPLPTRATSSRTQAQAAPPIQQAQPLAAAAQPMAREASKDGSDSGDGPALPSTANWANRGVQQQRSRRGSHATSGAAPSPAISNAIPSTTEAVEETPELVEDQDESSGRASPIEAAEPTSIIEDVSHPVQEEFYGTEILRSINSDVLTWNGPKVHEDDLAAFPLLFDDHGGEKRRLMREQEQQEQQKAERSRAQPTAADPQSVAEPVEEQEPESGSLQLGGEPEDNGREANQAPGFQRRQSSQLPIQRCSPAGPFGPSLGQQQPSYQNIGNLSSVNGRSLTPLQQSQLSMFKSPSGVPPGFMDHISSPGGLGNPLNQNSALFQQQGHNRQSSRYSFAQDGAAGPSSIKPSANAKMMQQQASMMPPSSHPQQGFQSFNSSIAAPPGLSGVKSNTPPIGGGMFGQGHGFGNAMGGTSGFGGASKENGSEMIREMLRNRPSVGGNQGLDTSKREYMFPNFLHQQFPSASSTPAPASGLLASLYGPQTGAFHDFGQKQKKKGKKHRHANTSSSGGGGLVDLADPSILQARMQHQQQSNAGVGQGLFNGQAQDDSTFDDESFSHSVDALVSDSVPDDLSTRYGELSREVSRSNTPAFPPGLPNPHGHPTPAMREDPIGRPSSRALPFTPSRQSSMSHAPRVATPLAMSQPSTPSLVKSKILPDPVPEEPVSQAQGKREVKSIATTSGMSNEIVAPSNTAPVFPPTTLPSATATPVTQSTLSAEEYPALGAQKETKPPVSRKVSKTLASSSKAPSTPKVSNAQKSAKPSEKKPTPSVLTIPATKMVGPPETPSKTISLGSEYPSLPPSKSIQNTVKTIRVTQTPKTEVPPIASPAPTSATYSSYIGRHFSNSEVPDTPSEQDNASTMSATASRASSPAPSKSGQPRPSKLNTAQKKKLQKEKSRQGVDEAMAAHAEAKRADEEQAPVVGRKKKEKKEKPNASRAANAPMPAPSRPASPPPAAISREESKSVEPVVPETPAAVINDKTASKAEVKGKNKAKAQQSIPSPEPPRAPIVEHEENAEKSTAITPAIIAQKVGFKANHAILKIPNGVGNDKKRDRDPSSALLDSNPKLNISPEHRADLMAGKPVHQLVSGSIRIMLTPNGDCVRNLTVEEENRFLELQARLAANAGPNAFVSEKQNASTGFNLLGGRAVPNGTPSYLPSIGANNTTPLDPVSKIQRDEALSYINQYVLPSLSHNAQSQDNVLSDGVQWSDLNGNASDNPSGGLYSGHGILEEGLEHMLTGNRDIDRGPQAQNVQLLSEKESEYQMQMSKKETQDFEKKLLALLKKNRKLLLPSH